MTNVISIWASLVPIATLYQWSVVAFLTLKGFPLSTRTLLNWFQNSTLCDCDLFIVSLLLIDLLFLIKSLGCSITWNIGALSEFPILYAWISIKKKLILLFVLLFNHSIALLCSSLASFTIQTTTLASNPDAYVIIFPKWSWLDISNWFSIITFIPVVSSLANKSHLYAPT